MLQNQEQDNMWCVFFSFARNLSDKHGRNTVYDLTWAKGCVLIEAIGNTVEVDFRTNGTTLFVLIVNSSINDSIKFLENLKQGLQRTTISWRSGITTK